MKIAFSGYQKHLNQVMKQPWAAVLFPADSELSWAQPNSSCNLQSSVNKSKATKNNRPKLGFYWIFLVSTYLFSFLCCFKCQSSPPKQPSSCPCIYIWCRGLGGIMFPGHGTQWEDWMSMDSSGWCFHREKGHSELQKSSPTEFSTDAKASCIRVLLPFCSGRGSLPAFTAIPVMGC